VLALAAGSVAVAELSTGGGTGGARVIAARVLDHAGSAYVRIAGGRAVLVVNHFPAAPPGQIYEVWLKRPGRDPQPTAALFDVTSAGAGEVGVPGDLSGVGQVLVTPEPLGGSSVPTHAAVIEASLSSA
jgi:hypothetical protein